MDELPEEAIQKNNDLVAVMDRHLVMLREHFDSVQIIACRKETGLSDGSVSRFCRGAGSFYERMGAARAWLLREDEQERLDQARYDRERND